VVWQTARTFEPTEFAPTEARHFVDECLTAWGLSEVTERIVLAVSELMTNAVTHGRGPIAVSLAATADRVRVDVGDEGGGTPVMRPPDPTHRLAGGWGLRLVNALADNWGIDTHGQRTTVWFEHWLR
jgi:anti-sigma regulatory factor (Ser/Thr protein kinase)